jgi:hypothetical protein
MIDLYYSNFEIIHKKGIENTQILKLSKTAFAYMGYNSLK